MGKPLDPKYTDTLNVKALIQENPELATIWEKAWVLGRYGN
jgi:hypothetical protein